SEPMFNKGRPNGSATTAAVPPPEFSFPKRSHSSFLIAAWGKSTVRTPQIMPHETGRAICNQNRRRPGRTIGCRTPDLAAWDAMRLPCNDQVHIRLGQALRPSAEDRGLPDYSGHGPDSSGSQTIAPTNLETLSEREIVGSHPRIE